MQIKRGHASFPLDTHLDYDPFLLRHYRRVLAEARRFRPDLVHITGPGDMGMLGWVLATHLGVPLVMSWHTNLHEYAGRRLERLLWFLGERLSRFLGSIAERISLKILDFFYSRSRVVLAPNQELVEMLNAMTKRPVFLMQRGVDTELFSPAHRSRSAGRFRIGYVGRLTPEKNVRLLASLGKALLERGHDNIEFVIIGQGSEDTWLGENVPNVILTGVLKGQVLAEAYANMDLFVFPSTTDTFGNVILEALASGVPAVVTNSGGPKFLVRHGITGFVTADDQSFVDYIASLVSNPQLHQLMATAAREHALNLSWDAVFERVFLSYQACFQPNAAPRNPKQVSTVAPA